MMSQWLRDTSMELLVGIVLLVVFVVLGLTLVCVGLAIANKIKKGG